MSESLLHTLGNFALLWLFAGSCQWVIIDGVGVTGATYDKRVAAGDRPHGLHVAAAIVVAIVAWPVVTRLLWTNRRAAVRMLRRTFWGSRPN